MGEEPREGCRSRGLDSGSRSGNGMDPSGQGGQAPRFGWLTGGGDAGAMAGGVSRATIPTLAGMVAAISGVFANIYLTRKSNEENQLLKDRMVMDH